MTSSCPARSSSLCMGRSRNVTLWAALDRADPRRAGASSARNQGQLPGGTVEPIGAKADQCRTQGRLRSWPLRREWPRVPPRGVTRRSYRTDRQTLAISCRVPAPVAILVLEFVVGQSVCPSAACVARRFGSARSETKRRVQERIATRIRRLDSHTATPQTPRGSLRRCLAGQCGVELSELLT